MLMKFLVFCVIMYNIVFIPLQFAYDISFKWPFWFLEILSIAVYIADFILRFRNLRMLILTNGKMEHSSNIMERKLAEDKEEYMKRILYVKVELVCSAVAALPFAFVFDVAGVKKDSVLIVALCLLRLVKIWPLFKIFNVWKKREVDLVRIIEVIFNYYLACHIIACYCISIAARAPDVRDTWMRRISVP